MKALPQITEAEYEVMNIIWQFAPISTNEITDKLITATKWSPKTIHTLIKRLVDKKAISYEKQSRVFVYTPLVHKEEYINHESNHFLERFYKGNISNMISAYLEHDKLSAKEISRLRDLLKRGTDKGD